MNIKKWFLLLTGTVCSLTGNCRADSSVEGNRADYIVVGVGTAGGVVANKLTNDRITSCIALQDGPCLNCDPLIRYSKNRAFTVLAGLLGKNLSKVDPSRFNIPPDIQEEFNVFLDPSISNPLYERGLTIPQAFADGREILWIMPLPEGGGSAINAGAWCWGTDQVYSQWEAIAGPEWSVSRIREIYRQLEKYDGQTANPSARGYNGPLKVMQDPKPTIASKKFSQAVINATGFPFVLDYNDPLTPIGVSTQFQITERGHNGKYRVSSPTAFLDENVVTLDGKGVNQRKLRIDFDSFATRIIWNGNRATGVEYVQDGQTKQVFARKGVIICAGLRSSTLLLHSGIGPSDLLNGLGIPVIFDNPNVGEGLADQPHVVVAFTANPEDSEHKFECLFSQFAWLPEPGGDPTIRSIRISTVNNIPGVMLGIVDLVQPESRGKITINTANRLAPPVIDYRVLSNPNDMALFVDAFTIYLKNINTALHAIDPLYQLVFPDPAILDSPALVEAFIREEVGSNMHFQSHCLMAPLASGGVVNSSGRVYGTQNLFIADNSIVPLCMDGSPMASAFLIGANVSRMLGYP